jgi:very-short-patch-repair endonuclease
MWEELRYWRYSKVRFRRQAVLRGYIADFYCPKARLVVEIDGPIHDPWKDRIRDGHLAKVGLRVIRFTNAQVLTNLPQVLVEIREAYRSRCKYLRRKAVKVNFRKLQNTISTIPQDSSQQQGIKVFVSDDYDERCAYVQIVDKYSETIKLVVLPLFESPLTPQGKRCPPWLN